MPENVLKASIQVTAPGVKETFAQVANSTKQLEGTVSQLGTTVTATEVKIEAIPIAIDRIGQSATSAAVPLSKLQQQVAAFGGLKPFSLPDLGALTIPTQVSSSFNQVAESARLVQRVLAELASKGGVSIGALEIALKDFEIRLKSATNPNDIAKFIGAINGLKQKIGELRGLGSGTFDKLKASTNAANNALINTGRIFQDLPFGIIGIANNINPLIESFQRLSRSAKETGTSVGTELVKSLSGGGGLGLAFSLITAAVQFATIGLSAFFRSASGGKDDLEALQAELKDTASDITNLTSSIGELKKSMDLVGEFQDFGKKLSGGLDIDLLKLKLQRQEKFVSDIKASIDRANAAFDRLTTDPRRSSGSAKEQKEIEKTITESIEKLGEANKQFADETFKTLIIQRQIALQQGKDTKEINDKRLKDFEKFVSDTISRAKELDAAFKNIINITPDFSVLDTEQEKFRKAFDFLRNFDAGKFKITFKPELNDKEVKDAVDLLGKQFQAAKVDVILPLEFPIDPKVIPQTQAEITRILKEIGPKGEKEEKFDITIGIAVDLDKFKENLKKDLAGAFNIKITPPDLTPVKKQLLDIQNQAIFAADTISGILTPAFQGLFDAILSGEDPIKSFFKGLEQAVAQLISKLVAAAVEALVLAAIFGSIGGASGFAAIFAKLLGFEKGGRPPVGKDVLVGEKRTEIFVPDVGQPVLLGVGGPHLFRADRPGKIIPKVGKAVNSVFKSVSKTTETGQVVIRDISKEITQVLQSVANTIVKQSDNVLRSVVEYHADSHAKSKVVNTEKEKIERNQVSVSSVYEYIARISDNAKQISSAVASVIDRKESKISVSSSTDKVKEGTKEKTDSTKLTAFYKLFTAQSSVLDSVSKLVQSSTATNKELYSVAVIKEISSTLSKVFEYSTASTESEKAERTTSTLDKTIHSAFESTYSTIIDKLAKVYKTDTSKEASKLDTIVSTASIKDISRFVSSDTFTDSVSKLFSVSRETTKAKEVTKNYDSAFASLVNNSYEKNVSSAFGHLKEIFSSKESKDRANNSVSSVSKLIQSLVSFDNATILLSKESAFQSLVTSATSSIKELKELFSSYSNASLIQKDSRETHSENSTVFQSIRQFTSQIVNTFSSVLERIIDRIKPQPIPAITNNITKILTAASTLNNLTYRAKGGPVSRNAPTIVGEKGWELFTPSVSGHIIPHHKVSSYIKNLVEKNLLSTKEINLFKSTRSLKDLNLSKIFNRRITNISELTHKELSTIIGKQFGGFRAGGGFVGGGSTIAVGERNFELFVPNTGSSITNNNNTSNGVGRVSGGTLKVEGNIRIAGSDLIAVISNAQRSQSRLS